MANVNFAGERWTDSFSHGELIRAGIDERCEIDPAKLRFLIQGVSDEAKGKVLLHWGATPALSLSD